MSVRGVSHNATLLKEGNIQRWKRDRRIEEKERKVETDVETFRGVSHFTVILKEEKRETKGKRWNNVRKGGEIVKNGMKWWKKKME